MIMKIKELLDLLSVKHTAEVEDAILNVARNITKLPYRVFFFENNFYIEGNIKKLLLDYKKNKIKKFDLEKNIVINDNYSLEEIYFTTDLQTITENNKLFLSLLCQELLKITDKNKNAENLSFCQQQIGEIFSGLIVKSNLDSVLVKFSISPENEIFGILNKDGRIRNEKYEVDRKMFFLVRGVDQNQKQNPFFILDRRSEDFLTKLLIKNIDTLKNKEVNIVDLKRIPGFRAKVLVKGDDAVKKVVGVSGIKIAKLKLEVPERIDVVEYHPIPLEQLKLLLKPAEVIDIREDENAFYVTMDVKYMRIFIGTRENGNLGLHCKLISQIVKKNITFISKKKDE